jgi:DNA-binding beta-propeller fold protein YncE
MTKQSSNDSKNNLSSSNKAIESEIYCMRCLNEDEEQIIAIQFCSDCKMPLCENHANMHQNAKKSKYHVFISIGTTRIKYYESKEVTERYSPNWNRVSFHVNAALSNNSEQVLKFGCYGYDIGQFKCPFFVHTDREGNIYVSDSYNHRIQKFNNKGELVGSYGTGMNRFNEPMGITINSKCEIIIADYGNHSIQVFDENMQFKYRSKSELKYPCGITTDSEDNIYIVERGFHHVRVLDKYGVYKQIIGKEGAGDGEFKHPWGISVCKTDGRIFVSDTSNHRIQVFSSNGKFLFKFGSYGVANGQFIYPNGIVLDISGQYLFVCDEYNHRIQVFSQNNGTFIKSYGLGNLSFNKPCGICLSPSGQIIISEAGEHRIQILSFNNDTRANPVDK